MLLLFQRHTCPAVGLWLSLVLKAVASCVDGRATTWGGFDKFKEIHHPVGPKGAKRRRFLHAFKEAVSFGAFVEKRAHSGDAILKSMEPKLAGHGLGRSCELEMLHDAQAASWDLFTDAHVVHSAWDGVRLGNPKKEHIIIVAHEVRKGGSSIFPPQVPPVLTHSSVRN